MGNGGPEPQADAGPAPVPSGRCEGTGQDGEAVAVADRDRVRGGTTLDQRLKADAAKGKKSRLTPESLAALTAVIASFSFILSVTYDWGFLSALGISMADAPTSLSDHLGSWIVWAPRYLLIGLLYPLVRLVHFRSVIEGATFSARPSVPKDKKGTYALGIAGAAVMFLAWLLGDGSPGPLTMSAAMCWMVLVAWITDHPQLTLPRSALVLVTLMPVLVLLFFYFGYGSLERVERRPLPRAHVQVHATSASGSAIAEKHVLRSFTNWMLVRDPDGTGLDWVRMEQVDRIEVSPQDRPILCGVFGLRCRGDSGVNPTSSRPDGA